MSICCADVPWVAMRISSPHSRTRKVIVRCFCCLSWSICRRIGQKGELTSLRCSYVEPSGLGESLSVGEIAWIELATIKQELGAVVVVPVARTWLARSNWPTATPLLLGDWVKARWVSFGGSLISTEERPCDSRSRVRQVLSYARSSYWTSRTCRPSKTGKPYSKDQNVTGSPRWLIVAWITRRCSVAKHFAVAGDSDTAIPVLTDWATA